VFAPDLKAAPLASAFVQAAAQAGYGLSDDANGERQEGFGRLTHPRRTAAAAAQPAPTWPGAEAGESQNPDRLRWYAESAAGDRAIGIEFAPGNRLTQGNQAATAYADRDVIVVGRAINSPQLLQLSGSAPPRIYPRASTRASSCRRRSELNDHPDIVIPAPLPATRSIFGANRGMGKILTGLRWFAGSGASQVRSF